MKYFILLLFVSGLAFSQGRSLVIGDVTLSIGMKAESVIGSFPKNISVSTLSSLNDITYTVQQHNLNDPGYKIIGQFVCVEGRITSITKYYGTYSTDNFSQGLADLYNLLSKAGAMKFSAYPESKPDKTSKFKSIVFNNKNTSYYLNVNDYGFSLAESVK